MKFRKKPIVIEAFQWEPGMQFHTWSVDIRETPFLKDSAFILTLEGQHIIQKGDWLIKGIKGEFYPVKNDIFMETYEPVA